jgi:hypothetical protein
MTRLIARQFFSRRQVASRRKLTDWYTKAGVTERFRGIIEDRPNEFDRERQTDA